MIRRHIRHFDPVALRSLAKRCAITAAILAAIALGNAFSARANFANFGDALPLWKPMVWEFSSVLLIGVLIPAVAWFNAWLPVVSRRWYLTVPAHLLATLPFSIVHVGGMVGLRELAYQLAGESYSFGPVLSAWVYEYRKDFVTYWLIVTCLGAFSAWRHARVGQAASSAPAAHPRRAPDLAPAIEASGDTDPLDRLVVRRQNREFILDVANITRLESDGNYVAVHAAGLVYRMRGSLASLASRLDGRRFIQIHRTQIVNIDHVREIQPWNHGDFRVLIDDGSFVNFSRRYRARLDRLFDPSLRACGDGAVRP